MVGVVLNTSFNSGSAQLSPIQSMEETIPPDPQVFGFGPTTGASEGPSDLPPVRVGVLPPESSPGSGTSLGI